METYYLNLIYLNLLVNIQILGWILCMMDFTGMLLKGAQLIYPYHAQVTLGTSKWFYREGKKLLFTIRY